MTSSDESRMRRRRWPWLVILLIILFGAYSAGWFWMARRLKSEADGAVASLNTKGIAAGCANLQIGGFPLAFTVTCDNVAYEDDARDIAASAGSFYATVTPLWPFEARGRLEAPLRTAIPGMPPLWIDWDDLRGNAELSLSMPRSVTLNAEGLSGQTDPSDDSDPVQLFSAAQARATLQPDGRDIDYSGSFTDLEIDSQVLGGRTIPPLAGNGAIKLKNGLALLATKLAGLRGQSIEIGNLDLSSGDAHISVSGPVSVDAEGLIDADLRIRLRNPKAVATVLAGAFPEKASKSSKASPRSPCSAITLPCPSRSSRAGQRLASFRLGASSRLNSGQNARCPIPQPSSPDAQPPDGRNPGYRCPAPLR
jgi:hypothetical protein